MPQELRSEGAAAVPGNVASTDLFGGTAVKASGAVGAKVE